MNLPGLLSELQRRRVFRVAAAYAVAAWLVVQIAATTFPHLNLPGWMITAVIVLVALGFPLALVFAWIFDVTPEGVVRTPAVERPAEAALPPRSSAGWKGQRLAAVGGILVLGLAGGAFIAFGGSLQSATAPETQPDRTIAVLPFVDMSEGRDQEYFSDGITEDILGRLSRIGGLHVTSRTSAMSYKGSTKRLREIAEELGVVHVLEGSVRRVGDRLRISVQLVDARSDQSLWSVTYDREANDVFAIQTEIAERIAEALRVRLTSEERARVGFAGTENFAAYDLYLRGIGLLYRPAPNLAEQRAKAVGAIALFRQALAFDPSFSKAHAGLAWAYDEHPDLPRRARRDSTLAFSQRAISLAPDLPDGYAELGWYYVTIADHDRAGEQFREALQRDPNHDVALAGLAHYFRFKGRVVEGLDYAERVVRLQPTLSSAFDEVARLYALVGDFDAAETWYRRAWAEVSSIPGTLHCELGWIAYERGDRAMAREQLRALLDRESPSESSYRCAGHLELALGNLSAARLHLDRYAATALDADVPRIALAYLAREAGERERAEALLAEAETHARERWRECEGRCENYNLASIATLRGRRAEAIEHLRRAVATGWGGRYPLATHPFFAEVAAEPGYQAVIADLRAHLDRERARLQQRQAR